MAPSRFALPSVPPGVPPTLATMGWALVMGAVGALLAWLIRSLALWLRPIVHVNRLLVTSALGLLIGLIAMGYQLVSGRSFAEVLFSGQYALPELVGQAASASLGVMILLVICKGLAYRNVSERLSRWPGFPLDVHRRGLGIAASGLPGMDLAPAIGMGIGAMCSAMLRLPLTSTLRRRPADGGYGILVTPQVVVAVVGAFVITNVLPAPGPKTAGDPALAALDAYRIHNLHHRIDVRACRACAIGTHELHPQRVKDVQANLDSAAGS